MVARSCEQVVSQDFLLLQMEIGFFHKISRKAFQGSMDLQQSGKVDWSENKGLCLIHDQGLSSVQCGRSPASSRQPATTAIRPRRPGPRDAELCVHPRAGPLLRLHLGPHPCYRDEAREALRAVMGHLPIQSLPFPRLDSSPSPSRL